MTSTPVKANELLTALNPAFSIVGMSNGDYATVPYEPASEAADRAEDAATDAEASAALAASYAPLIVPGSARKRLAVNAAGTGYTLSPRRKHVIAVHSQSNGTRSDTAYPWTQPPNLFYWNGGISGAIGTAWESASLYPNVMRTYYAEAAEYAWDHPDVDVYLIILGSPGVGIRSTIGMDYQWSTGLSGDPGTGKIGFDSAVMGSVTDVRYNITDADGYVRFVGGTTLGVSSVTPCRIESTANPSIYVEFDTGAMTDNTTYRNQPATVVASSSWPPADGTPVTVYSATDWVRNVILENVPDAFTALGLTGDDAVFDEIKIWPTEGDVSYLDSYEARDLPLLREFLGQWADARTRWHFTLPWPYSVASPIVIARWHRAIERHVGANSRDSVLVDLSGSEVTDWQDADNIHVGNGDPMVRIGKLIRRAAMEGGVKLPRYETGRYTPTFTPVTNVDSVTLLSATYVRVGDFVDCVFRVTVDPTLGALTPSQFRISLPIASDLKTNVDAVGLGVSVLDNYTARVSADAANDALLVDFLSESTGGYALFLQARYEII